MHDWTYFSRPGTRDRRAAQPSLMVTLDLGTVGYYNELVLFNTLNSALNKGYIAQYSVSPKGYTFDYTFRPLAGKSHMHQAIFILVLLTSIAGLVHVNDLDLTTQILVFPCQTCSVYAIKQFGHKPKILNHLWIFLCVLKVFFLVHTIWPPSKVICFLIIDNDFRCKIHFHGVSGRNMDFNYR